MAEREWIIFYDPLIYPFRHHLIAIFLIYLILMTNERLNYSFDNEQHQFLNKYYKFDLNRILLFYHHHFLSL